MPKTPRIHRNRPHPLSYNPSIPLLGKRLTLRTGSEELKRYVFKLTKPRKARRQPAS